MEQKKGALLATILLITSSAGAAETGASFLSVTSDPRVFALGQPHAVGALGSRAVDGGNPANIGVSPQRYEAFTTFVGMADGSKYGRLSAALASDGMLSGAGVSVTSLQSGSLDGADAAGNKTGSFNSSSFVAALGGAIRPQRDLNLGATVKVIKSSIGRYTSNAALAGDVGATYTMSSMDHPLSLGVSITNVGQAIKFLEQSDPLPSAVNLGAALSMGKTLVMATLNRGLADMRTEAGLGLEYGMGPAAFRVGYSMKAGQAQDKAAADAGPQRILGGVSAGLGLRVGVAEFDFAVSRQAPDLQPTALVSFSFHWGGASSRRQLAGRALRDSSEYQRPSQFLMVY
jgi:hypothetical protein